MNESAHQAVTGSSRTQYSRVNTNPDKFETEPSGGEKGGWPVRIDRLSARIAAHSAVIDHANALAAFRAHSGIPHTQQLTRRRSTRCHAKGKPQKRSRGRGAKFEETRDAETRYAARLTELLTLERKEEEEIAYCAPRGAGGSRRNRRFASDRVKSRFASRREAVNSTAWIFSWRRVAATAAAATWIFRGGGSRFRRGCDVDIPWRWVVRLRAGSSAVVG